MTLASDWARKLLEAATPGPWFSDSRPGFGLEFFVIDGNGNVLAKALEYEPDIDKANCALIAAAPQLLTDLVTELEWWHEVCRRFGFAHEADGRAPIVDAASREAFSRRLFELLAEVEGLRAALIELNDNYFGGCSEGHDFENAESWAEEGCSDCDLALKVEAALSASAREP